MTDVLVKLAIKIIMNSCMKTSKIRINTWLKFVCTTFNYERITTEINIIILEFKDIKFPKENYLSNANHDDESVSIVSFLFFMKDKTDSKSRQEEESVVC